jgi:hypothetical protein
VHEIERYLRSLQAELYRFASEYGAQVQPPSVNISEVTVPARLGKKAQVQPPSVNIAKDGRGELWLPARSVYERLQPTSPPAGLLFRNGAFFVFKELVRFGYQDENATAAVIYREELATISSTRRGFCFFALIITQAKGIPRRTRRTTWCVAPVCRKNAICLKCLASQ